MNKVVLMGRLTKEPDCRWTQQEPPVHIARYTLAVDRKLPADQRNKEGIQTADFISCVTFGKNADFAEKYLSKGTKICITGRIQTGSYTDRDGNKRYTTDVVVEDQEFAESKKDTSKQSYDDEMAAGYGATHQGSGYVGFKQEGNDGFFNIPDGIDEELPFT